MYRYYVAMRFNAEISYTGDGELTSRELVCKQEYMNVKVVNFNVW